MKRDRLVTQAASWYAISVRAHMNGDEATGIVAGLATMMCHAAYVGRFVEAAAQ